MVKRVGIDIGSDTLKAVVIDGEDIRLYEPKKIHGRVIAALKETLEQILEEHGSDVAVGLTGVNAEPFADILQQAPSEPIAIKQGIDFLKLDVAAVIEVGASTQRYLELRRNGKLRLENFDIGDKCGGGSGLLLEHFARRFNYSSIEEFSAVAYETEKTIGLSAKCGVFRESDVVHQQQKGTPKEVLAASLYRSSAESFDTILSSEIVPEGRIAVLGGTSLSRAFIKYLIEACLIEPGRVFVPKQSRHVGAIGATYYGKPVSVSEIIKQLEERQKSPVHYESIGPLVFKKSRIVQLEENWPYNAQVEVAAIGVDIGSVSTKAALIAKIDNEFRLLAYHYRRTEADPVGAAIDAINKVYQQVSERGYKIGQIVAGTTGSGRQLTGFIVGAAQIHIVDEITAQAAGITTVYPEREFTVIEFGGQDSKFINIEDGVVVDFEMNQACAAGTGALLEKYALHRGIRIEDYGRLALAAKNPPTINSTCAVLSEQSIIEYEQNNVPLEDLCAALTLATARNYLAKVVRGKEIKSVVVFQGAPAFNLGQVAALETVLGRGIIVPPGPHITGAIGAARYAYDTTGGSFRGFEKISSLDYRIGPFECKRNCGNRCNITLAEVGGEEFYIGDRCQRYSGRKKAEVRHSDLFRERQQIMVGANR